MKNMVSKKQTSAEYLKSNIILFLALLLGQVLFLVAASFIAKNIGFQNTLVEFDSNILLLISGFFGILCLLLGYSVFKRNNEKLRTIPDLAEKLTTYRTFLIINYALIEFPAFLAIVLFMLTGNKLFVILAVLLIFYLSRNKPTKEKLYIDLNLSENEKMIIDDPESIVIN